MQRKCPFCSTPADHHQGFAEVHLGIPWRMRQRHEHLALMEPLQPHVIFNDGVAARESVFFFQPVEDALGRVTLLAVVVALSPSRI